MTTRSLARTASLLCGLAASPASGLAQSVVSVWTTDFEIYAPDSGAAARAQSGLESAAREFRRYVGSNPPTIAVVMLDGKAAPAEPRGGFPVLYWFTANGLAAARAHSGSTAASDTVRDRAFAESALPHEACHWFLAAYLDARSQERGRGQAAATPGAHRSGAGVPAWYNEGFATLCEPSNWQDKRRAQMRKSLDAAIPLTEFFSMPHLKGVNSLPTGSEPGTAAERINAMQQGDDRRASIFYAQAHSFLRFITEQESAAFVGEVARTFSGGGTFADALRRADKLPGNIAAVESLWRKWLLARN